MSWFGDLFVSRAKKNKSSRGHQVGGRNRANAFKNPEKYMGGKGSLKRRRQMVNGPKTNRNYQDNRANSAEEPIYKKVTTYRRSNPRATDWVMTSQPKYTIISEPVFLNELSDDMVKKVEEAGNSVKIEREESEKRYTKTIMFGNGIIKNVSEYRPKDSPDLDRF